MLLRCFFWVPIRHFFIKKQEKLECAVNGRPLQIPTLVAAVANSLTDKQMDSLSHTLTLKGSPVESLVKFCPVVWDKTAFVQADQGLCCLLTELVDTVVYVNEQRMSRSDCTDAHDHIRKTYLYNTDPLKLNFIQ